MEPNALEISSQVTSDSLHSLLSASRCCPLRKLCYNTPSFGVKPFCIGAKNLLTSHQLTSLLTKHFVNSLSCEVCPKVQSVSSWELRFLTLFVDEDGIGSFPITWNMPHLQIDVENQGETSTSWVNFLPMGVGNPIGSRCGVFCRFQTLTNGVRSKFFADTL
ncbi:hypothetical protein NPIL_25481 [Nephila pilipes]|uniref:Uncharacterized protein n=1 Tax=Nephila pilipes TaxID=299642 RepID=A0A8X6QTP7_NEPPI|nr:hypothetical protein NPIL_25481 [Nephila pilipes]